MSNAKPTSPAAATSEAERKAREAAVEAELLSWAELYVGNYLCDCCERTAAEIGEPCRKPLEWHYRRQRRAYDSDPACRNMIDRFANIRLFDEAASRPNDMTAQ